MQLRALTRPALQAVRTTLQPPRVTRAARPVLLNSCRIKQHTTLNPRSCSTSVNNVQVKRTDHTFSRGRVLEAASALDDKGWIEVSWAGGLTTQYPYVYLRDTCTCGDCLDPTSKARIFMIMDLDVDIKPKAVKVNAEGQYLEVTWPDGHVSKYPAEWLEGRSFNEECKRDRKHWHPAPAELWSNDIQDKIPCFDFEKMMEDDQTLYDWITTIQRVGIVLLKNAPGKTGQIQRIGDKVAFLRKTNYGEVFQVKSKADPSNLAFTPRTLPLHSDLNFYVYTPGMQMLHCVQQVPTEGGENIFADGFNAAYVLKEKNREMYDILTTTLVDFLDYGTDYYKFFKLNQYPVIQTDKQGVVNKICYTGNRDNYLDVPLDKVIPLYRAMKAFFDILYDPQYHITYKLEQGDIVCFNNHRLLHGRRGYRVLAEGQRHLEGGYLDWDELNSKRRVLRLELEHRPETVSK